MLGRCVCDALKLLTHCFPDLNIFVPEPVETGKEVGLHRWYSPKVGGQIMRSTSRFVGSLC